MLDRIKRLEENIHVLSSLKKRFSYEDVSSDKTNEWALRYGLLESLQMVIGISCHIVSKYNLGNPATYSECIELLRKFDYITTELEDRLLAMIGLRNILVHEYISVDVKKLYSLMDNLDDLKRFIDAVKDL